MCEKCKDAGYMVQLQNNIEIFLGFCDCEKGRQKKQELWEKKLLGAGIPQAYWNLHFADFKPQSLVITHKQFQADVEGYLHTIKERREEGTIWLIFGSTGVGKTLGAALILKEALKKDYTCSYIVWTDLIDKIFAEDDEKIIQKLREVDFLVLDDLGRDGISKDSKFIESLLEKVIKHRLSNKMPTILVSPIAYRELSARFPILTALLPPKNINKVDGASFRTNSI